MSEGGPSSSERGRGAPRARRSSRGGLGKYLRSRGRGHRGGGRPAEFKTRLVLEDEDYEEIDPDSEEAKAERAKYAKRSLGSNADRYEEPEENDEAGDEEEKESEIDMSEFEDRMRNLGVDRTAIGAEVGDEEDEVDHSLAKYAVGATGGARVQPTKGKAQKIEWNAELEEMAREKAAAEAQSALKARLRANAETLKKVTPSYQRPEKSRSHAVEAPPLPLGDSAPPPPLKKPKEQMEDFLDDLLG